MFVYCVLISIIRMPMRYVSWTWTRESCDLRNRQQCAQNEICSDFVIVSVVAANPKKKEKKTWIAGFFPQKQQITRATWLALSGNPLADVKKCEPGLNIPSGSLVLHDTKQLHRNVYMYFVLVRIESDRWRKAAVKLKSRFRFGFYTR